MVLPFCCLELFFYFKTCADNWAKCLKWYIVLKLSPCNYWQCFPFVLNCFPLCLLYMSSCSLSLLIFVNIDLLFFYFKSNLNYFSVTLICFCNWCGIDWSILCKLLAILEFTLICHFPVSFKQWCVTKACNNWAKLGLGSLFPNTLVSKRAYFLLFHLVCISDVSYQFIPLSEWLLFESVKIINNILECNTFIIDNPF